MENLDVIYSELTTLWRQSQNVEFFGSSSNVYGIHFQPIESIPIINRNGRRWLRRVSFQAGKVKILQVFSNNISYEFHLNCCSFAISVCVDVNIMLRVLVNGVKNVCLM